MADGSACGTGAELVLRLKFFIKEEITANGIEELLRGPFDLLRWYQNLFLEAIADSLAESRKNFVKNNLPQNVAFADLCITVRQNCNAYNAPQIVQKIRDEITRLEASYATAEAKGTPINTIERSSCLELGYVVLNTAGKKGFKTLLNG